MQPDSKSLLNEKDFQKDGSTISKKRCYIKKQTNPSMKTGLWSTASMLASQEPMHTAQSF